MAQQPRAAAAEPEGAPVSGPVVRFADIGMRYGRAPEVLRDVNDRVAAGEVLVRLSAVEQQAGVDAARAQRVQLGLDV